MDRNGVVWEGAAGERVIGSGTEMTTDTVGSVFSVTKAITGPAAMQLVEQGKLDLDALAGNVCLWLHEVQVVVGELVPLLALVWMGGKSPNLIAVGRFPLNLLLASCRGVAHVLHAYHRLAVTLLVQDGSKLRGKTEFL